MINTIENRIQSINAFKYANSSILVAYLEDAGIDTNGINVYNFTS
jgi:hypothetical protein